MFLSYLRLYPAWRKNSKQIKKSYQAIGAGVSDIMREYDASMAARPINLSNPSLEGRIGYGQDVRR